MDTIHESARQTPVVAKADVVVVGGGIAGVASALAARRNGCSVILLEKQCVLGGLATSGMIAIYLPICDGRGRQVAAGLAEELLWRTEDDAPASIPPAWRGPADVESRAAGRFLSRFEPHPYMLSLERLLVAEGVEIHYDNRFVGAVCDGDGRIDAVLVENASGRGAIHCKAVVDASGDALVCRAVDEPTVRHANNRRAAWFIAAGEKTGPFLVANHVWIENVPDSEPDFVGDNAEDVRRHLLASRPLVAGKVAELREKKADPTLHAAAIATMPDFRVTRTLAGAFELAEAHDHVWFDDAVGLIGDWRKAGPVFALPYRTIAATKTANLLVAGRCVSAKRDGAEITRVIPTCSVTGQAAGVAAATVARDGTSVRSLDVPALQNRLREQGALIDPALLD